MSSSDPVRGAPLTPLMEFAGPDGIRWVAYIEAFPPVRRWRFLSQTMLPGRRLRFDSANGSLVCFTVPAGSPFLPERRLRTLLAQSSPLPPEPAPEPTLPERGRDILHAIARGYHRVWQLLSNLLREGGHRARSAWRLHAARRAMAHHS